MSVLVFFFASRSSVNSFGPITELHPDSKGWRCQMTSPSCLPYRTFHCSVKTIWRRTHRWLYLFFWYSYSSFLSKDSSLYNLLKIFQLRLFLQTRILLLFSIFYSLADSIQIRFRNFSAVIGSVPCNDMYNV